ncbi:MAG: hypothetical protein ACK4TJ_00785 [Tabrizicola sp.]
MPRLMRILAVALLTAGCALPTLANGCWDCEPEPPIEEPEPPAPPALPIYRPSDRDPLTTPAYYPCCVRDGAVVVLRRDLFSSTARTLRRCERAIARHGRLDNEDQRIGALEAALAILQLKRSAEDARP